MSYFSDFVGQLREGLDELRDELRSNTLAAPMSLSPGVGYGRASSSSTKPAPGLVALSESKRLVLCGYPGDLSNVRIQQTEA